jgi:predicted transcriptional regulator of viral defense system
MLQLSHQEQTLYFEALRQDVQILDMENAASFLKASPERIRVILSSLARKGATKRIGKGRYALVPPTIIASKKAVIDPYSLIDDYMMSLELGDAYYLAYATAARLHYLSEQVPQQMLIALKERRFSRQIGTMRVRFITLRDNKFFGVKNIRYRDTSFQVSDMEKTVLDCLDRPSLVSGFDEAVTILHNAWGKIDQNRLLDYTIRMGNASLAQRLGYLLSHAGFEHVQESLLDGLIRMRGNTPVLLDLSESGKGKVDHDWHVKINQELDSWAEVVDS